MDIKAKVNEIVEKLTENKDLMEQFKKDPVKAIEGLIGIDLPDDVANQIIDAVKAKITVDNVKDLAEYAKGLLGKLFNK